MIKKRRLGRGVAIVGAGMSPFGMFRERDSRDLFVDAFRAMIGSVDNGVRLILFVVSGLESDSDRRRESLRLVNWAFREFSIAKVFERDTPVARARVSLGSEREVGLVSETDLFVASPFWAKDEIKVTLKYREPLEAPIEKGSHVANLVVGFPGLPETTYPLVAETPVERGGLLARISAVFEIFWIRVHSLVPGMS